MSPNLKLPASLSVVLKRLGEQLDENQALEVFDGGIVRPNNSPVVNVNRAKEKDDETSKKRRAQARQRKRRKRLSRSKRGSRQARKTSPTISAKLRSQYRAQVDAVKTAYPGTVVWEEENGMWLFVKSQILQGLERKATFLVLLPFLRNVPAKGWGFWTTHSTDIWIGPRHTNFDDGSICAFDSNEWYWGDNDEIILLLDLYTLWALRHLHLEFFDRWPGYQSAPHVYERITEFRPGEYCGCSKFDRRYSECCENSDKSKNLEAEKKDFEKYNLSLKRYPPDAIVEYIKYRNKRPKIHVS